MGYPCAFDQAFHRTQTITPAYASRKNMQRVSGILNVYFPFELKDDDTIRNIQCA